MVMWNLVGHGIKWAARGVDAFSKTDAGKATGSAISRATRATRSGISQLAATQRATSTKRTNASAGSTSKKLHAGQRVRFQDGSKGTVLRYLRECDLTPSSGDETLTDMVVVELARFTSEYDRYIMSHDSAVYPE